MENKTENKQIDVAQLKKAIEQQSNELKTLFLARKVKKDKQDKQYFLDVAKLFDDFKTEAPKFCDVYDIDLKYLKVAEKKGLKAVEMLLSKE